MCGAQDSHPGCFPQGNEDCVRREEADSFATRHATGKELKRRGQSRLRRRKTDGRNATVLYAVHGQRPGRGQAGCPDHLHTLRKQPQAPWGGGGGEQEGLKYSRMLGLWGNAAWFWDHSRGSCPILQPGLADGGFQENRIVQSHIRK